MCMCVCMYSCAVIQAILNLCVELPMCFDNIDKHWLVDAGVASHHFPCSGEEDHKPNSTGGFKIHLKVNFIWEIYPLVNIQKVMENGNL